VINPIVEIINPPHQNGSCLPFAKAWNEKNALKVRALIGSMNILFNLI